MALVLAFLAASLRAFGQSAPPPNYYDTALGKTGATLKSALHEIIKGHTVLPYTSSAVDTWDALKILDQDPANAANVLLVYSGIPRQNQSNGPALPGFGIVSTFGRNPMGSWRGTPVAAPAPMFSICVRAMSR